MNICILDGQKIKDREMLHDILADTLHFPDWYGRNLDALYDCLTDLQEKTEIRFLQKYMMEERLGSYVISFINVIDMASRENPNVIWKVEEEREDRF